MSAESIPIHYVSTLDEARRLVAGRRDFWVSNCGCREGRGGCKRTRMDICLLFEDIPPTGSGKRVATMKDVEEILRLAESSQLVPRPFRNDDRTAAAGICFCCDDCCSYFLDPAEKCDKGASIERTDLELCTQCGACVDVCHFGARAMAEGELAIDRDKCYGCGVCAGVCPVDCIEMIDREGQS
ncbi:MAG: 4Fe-4S binding protein [Candidatus Krumholzibacteriia bacterium]